MAKLSVRLNEGVYEAVGEVAEEFDISKSDAVTLLVFAGLSLMKGRPLSKRTQELMTADTLESYGALTRVMAKLELPERSAVEKKLGDLSEKLARAFPAEAR